MSKTSRIRTAALAVSLLGAAALPSRALAVGFSPPVTFSTTGTATRAVIGDFNGDTIPDIAAGTSSNISVLLGTGGGAFAPRIDTPVTGGFSKLVAADLNHDDDLDLVWISSSNIRIALGNGDGTFAAPSTIAGSIIQTGLVVADFNEDTHLDLAVSVPLSVGQAFVYLGDGTGAFGPGTSYPVGTEPISNPQDVATGDFDGDGNLDLAFANAGATTGRGASIIFGNGAGAFGSPLQLAFGDSPRAIAVGDLDGDLDLDIVVGNYISTTVNNAIVLLGDGQGGMGAPTTFPVGGGVPTVSLADLDGDGFLDMAVGNQSNNQISVLVNDGTGAFGAAANFPASSSARPRQLAIGDLSGDGRADIVVPANGTSLVAVLFNQAATTITGVATPTAAIGQSIVDEATLSGGDNPTGTIVFRAYGPDDADCAGAPAFVSAPVTVAGNGTYTSAPFMPSVAGTYRWIASYSGNARNQAASNGCDDPGQTSIVTTVSPAFTAAATPVVFVGNPIFDEATIADGFNPTGTITFIAYGPDDEDCSGEPAFVSAPALVAGNGTYSSEPYTPILTGTYRWVASYSGDASNEPAIVDCSDPAQASVVVNEQQLPPTKSLFQCQTATANALGAFVKLKVDCSSRCLRSQRRNGGPFTECLPPYGGSTAVCITGVLYGAEAKTRAKIGRACAGDCPSCYGIEGSCPDGAGLVADQEAVVDALSPQIFCVESGGSVPSRGEERCEDETARALVKFFASKSKCFERCMKRAFDGQISPTACQAGAVTDGTTASCIAKAEAKAASTIDRGCTAPRGTRPTCHPHATAAAWVAQAEAAVDRQVPATYCGSPSGAFLD